MTLDTHNATLLSLCRSGCEVLNAYNERLRRAIKDRNNNCLSVCVSKVVYVLTAVSSSIMSS